MLKPVKILGLIMIIMGCTFPITNKTYYSIDKKIKETTATSSLKANDYYGVLEIPKINFKQEFYAQNDSNNNVDKNIMLSKDSIMPDQKNSNIIILGHSGNGPHAYFKDLYKLNNHDLAYVYYKDTKYTYEIFEIEYEPKTGTLYLKNYSNILTLITCTKNNKNTQTIYYAKLKNEEKNVKK